MYSVWLPDKGCLTRRQPFRLALGGIQTQTIVVTQQCQPSHHHHHHHRVTILGSWQKFPQLGGFQLKAVAGKKKIWKLKLHKKLERKNYFHFFRWISNQFISRQCLRKLLKEKESRRRRNSNFDEEKSFDEVSKSFRSSQFWWRADNGWGFGNDWQIFLSTWLIFWFATTLVDL